jgi:hypothetical protein
MNLEHAISVKTVILSIGIIQERDPHLETGIRAIMIDIGLKSVAEQPGIIQTNFTMSLWKRGHGAIDFLPGILKAIVWRGIACHNQ